MSTEQEKIAHVFRTAAATLRTVTGERDQALAKVAEQGAQLEQIKNRLEAEKLASEMHQKGLNSDVEFNDLVLDIEKRAAAGDLTMLQEAVKMAAPNMGQSIGSINHDEARGGSSDFERYLVGDVG